MARGPHQSWMAADGTSDLSRNRPIKGGAESPLKGGADQNQPGVLLNPGLTLVQARVFGTKASNHPAGFAELILARNAWMPM